MATEGALGEAYEIRFIILTSPREGGTVCHTGGGGIQEERPGSRLNQAGVELTEQGPTGMWLYWGSWRSIRKAKGIRGFHCCVRMSLGQSGEGQRGISPQGPALSLWCISHLGRMLIACS